MGVEDGVEKGDQSQHLNICTNTSTTVDYNQTRTSTPMPLTPVAWPMVVSTSWTINILMPMGLWNNICIHNLFTKMLYIYIIYIWCCICWIGWWSKRALLNIYYGICNSTLHEHFTLYIYKWIWHGTSNVDDMVHVM